MAELKTKLEAFEAFEAQIPFETRCVEDRVLNNVELRALTSLLTYVADQQKMELETVLCIFEARFNVLSVKHLHAAQYHEAVRTLLTINLKTILN